MSKKVNSTFYLAQIRTGPAVASSVNGAPSSVTAEYCRLGGQGYRRKLIGEGVRRQAQGRRRQEKDERRVNLLHCVDLNYAR